MTESKLVCVHRSTETQVLIPAPKKEKCNNKKDESILSLLCALTGTHSNLWRRALRVSLILSLLSANNLRNCISKEINHHSLFYKMLIFLTYTLSLSLSQTTPQYCILLKFKTRPTDQNQLVTSLSAQGLQLSQKESLP